MQTDKDRSYARKLAILYTTMKLHWVFSLPFVNQANYR